MCQKELELRRNAEWQDIQRWIDKDGNPQTRIINCHSITGELALYKWLFENRPQPEQQLNLDLQLA